MTIYKHRTIYGRIRSHIDQVTEALLIQCRRGNSPIEGKRISDKVLGHFDRKTDEEIRSEADELARAAGKEAGKAAAYIAQRQGQWWNQPLQAYDILPSPPMEDAKGWRRHLLITSFSLEQTVSTLLVRAVIGAQMNADECKEACQDANWWEKAQDKIKSIDSHGVLGLNVTTDDVDINGDIIQIRADLPASYTASVIGKFAEEVVDAPFLKGSGVRILNAEYIGTVLYMETDAHDEHNTVTRIHDPEGRLSA